MAAGERFEVRAIGVVESPLVDLASAPKQGDEGAPDAVLAFDEAVAPALQDVAVGADLVLLTWLDRAKRDVLTTHPRNDRTQPEQGVFTTRSPDRPNPIGMHVVHVLAVDGTRLRVRDLEALDGTPIIDVKPILGPVGTR